MSIRYFHFLYREFVFLLLTNDFSGCFGISISGFFFFFFLSYTFSSIHQPWNNGENRCFRRVREISVCLVRVGRVCNIFENLWANFENKSEIFLWLLISLCLRRKSRINSVSVVVIIYLFIYLFCVYCVTPETIVLRTALHEGWQQFWLTVKPSGPFRTRVLITWAQWVGFGRSWCKFMYQDSLIAQKFRNSNLFIHKSQIPFFFFKR